MGKKRLATAIAYSSGDISPRMLATGRGRQAEQIIALARQAGVAVVEDRSLAVLLDSWAGGTIKDGGAKGGAFVKSGEFIPPWCWEAAAKILAFVLINDRESKLENKP